MPQPAIPFQPNLFDAPVISYDASYSKLTRIQLDDESWVDYAPGWVSGSDELFKQVLDSRKWNQRERWMYEKKVREPRLTAPWNLHSGVPLEPKILDEIRLALSARYGVRYDSIGFNLYRDGQDSVAWHTDRIVKEVEDPIVALLSLGEPRKFLMRPKGGGKSTPFMLGRGDLFVTGGKSQRKWDHCVPKVTQAGPRISLAFRYGLHPNAYTHKQILPEEFPDPLKRP